MKKTIFQLGLNILGLSVLTVLFFACHNPLQVQEQQKVKVTFTVADNTVRTVLPQASLTDVVSYKLMGGRNGTAETVLVESFTGTETSVSLDPGTWNFTLGAYNDSGENILQGKVKNKQINLTGVNQVNFTLSVINNGTGSIQITLNFPEVAGITRISTTGDVGSENFSPNTGGSFVYTKNGITAGDYFINFELYRGDVLRTVISELVLVRSGLTSSKTIILVGDDLKPIYLTGTVTIDPAVSVTLGTELTATYSGTETVTYQWNKDGNAISGATGTKYTPDSTGSYTVTVNAVGYNNGLTSAVVAVVGPAATVPGTTLQAKLVWLANTAESYSSYILEVSGDETIPSFTLSYSGKSNIVITLKSTGSLRTISLSGNGAMFTVGAGVILVLDNNITLQRLSGGGTLVSVSGTFIMNTGSAITKGSVYVTNGTFYMNGGIISGNNYTSSSSLAYSGGGVYISEGTFTMNGGEISGNTVSSSSPSSSYYNNRSYSGGGVLVLGGIFTMSGGKISNNNASSSSYNDVSNFSVSGGGVCAIGGTFTMTGGEISSNTTSNTPSHNNVGCGGVYGTLTMSGGTISNNTSNNRVFDTCGGVYGTLIMNGGTISNNIGNGVGGTLIMSGGTISNNNGMGMIVNGTFTMNDGIISNNNGRGVIVNSNGTFTMNDGTIQNNIGGVSVRGTFTMNGGTISNNTTTYDGGGVYVGNDTSLPIGIEDYSTFIMNSGDIYNNTATDNGGGVYVQKTGIFIMDSEATISRNTANNGGGVYVNGNNNKHAFTMNGGTISRNIASSNGGGVYMSRGISTMSIGEISANTAANGGGVYVVGTFTMSGGELLGNTASSSGGGVFVTSNGIFTKTGGTIYGYTSGNSNSNTVKNNSITILNNKGHTVWVDYSLITIHKETTAGPSVNLSWNGTSNPPTFSGGWEY